MKQAFMLKAFYGCMRNNVKTAAQKLVFITQTSNSLSARF